MADGEIRIDTTLTIDQAQKNLKKLESEAKSLAARLRTATINYDSAEETLRRMTAEGGKSTAEMSRMAENVAKAKDRVVVLERALADARESASNMSLAVKDMQFAQNERAAQALADAAERQKISIDELVAREAERQRAMQSTVDIANKTTQSINEQAQAAENLNTAFVETRKSWSEISEEQAQATLEPYMLQLDLVKDSLNYINGELKEMAISDEPPRGIVGWQKAAEVSGREIDRLTEKLSALETRAAFEISADKIISRDTQAELDVVSQSIQKVGDKLETVGTKAGITALQMDAIPATMERTTASATRQTSILRELASVAASVGSGIRKAFSGAASLIGKFGTKLLGIGGIFKGIHRDTRTTSNGFDRMRKRLVGLAVTAVVFNQIRRQLRSLVSYYGEALKANEQMYASFALLKGSALTAFQPIFEAVIPIIITLVNWLATAIQHLATFISMLFNVDPKQMQANAKALWDNVKATKAGTKELKKFLAPFDELITLSEDAAAGADISEIVPDFAWEPPAISPWMEKLKNIFKEADFGYWFDLGATAAQKFSDALNGIPWDDVREGARTLGINVAGLIGGFLSDESVWDSFGKTLAQGLNTALDFLHNFAVNYPWEKTGKAIAAGINSFVSTFDADLAADTFNVWAHGLLDLMIEAVEKIEWDKIGTKLAVMLNGVDWVGILTKVGTFAASAVNAFATAIYNFATTFDFIEVGRGIAAGINKFFATVNWTTLGLAFGTAVIGLMNLLITAVRETDWNAVGKAIGEMLAAMDINEMLLSLWTLVKEVASGIRGLIDGAFGEGTSDKILVVASTIGALVAGFKILSDILIGEALLGALGTLGVSLSAIAPIAGILAAGIVTVVAAVQEFSKAVQDGRINIDDLMTVLDKLGSFIGDLWNGVIWPVLSGAWDLFSEAMSNIMTILGGLITFLAGAFTGDWEKAWDGIKQIFTGLWDSIVFFLVELPQKLSGLITDIIIAATEALLGLFGIEVDIKQFFSDLWEDIKNVFSVVGEWFTGIFTDAWNGIKTAFSAVSEFFSGIWDEIVKVFSPAIEWFSGLFESIWQTIDDVFYNIGVIAEGCWDIIKAAWNIVASWFDENVIKPISELFSWLWGKVEEIFKPVAEWFKTKFNDAWTATKEIFTPVGDFFSGVWDNIKNAFGNITDWFKTKFTEAWTAVKNVFSKGGEIFIGIKEGILDGLKAVINGLIDGINKVISIPFDGINSALRTIKNINILGIQPFGGLREISIPKIPRLARGGIVDSATLAMIGERGREAVVPLSRNAEWMEPLNRLKEEQEITNSLMRTLIDALNAKEFASYLDGKPVTDTVYARLLSDIRSGRKEPLPS